MSKRNKNNKKLIHKTSIFAVIFITAVFAISIMVNFLLFVKNLPLESSTPVLKDIKFDGVIAYTGGKYRLGTTSLIIKNGFKGPVLISGVFPGTTLSSAFTKLGLTDEQIKQVNLDYNAISTAGNVQETLSWVKSNNLGKVLIITSYYHIPRAKLLLSKNNNNVEFIYYPVFSNSADISLIFKEYIKYILFKFKFITEISLTSQLPY